MLSKPTTNVLLCCVFRRHERTLLVVRDKNIKARPTMGTQHVTF